MKLTVFVRETLPAASSAYALIVLVPGISVTFVFQLVHWLLDVALGVQPFVLSSSHTLATPTLSVALPVTLNTLLLHRSADLGAVMLRVGLVTSKNVAVKLRFDAIVKCKAAV